MQISGEYGTELLLRYTEEQLGRDLERRRVGIERQAQAEVGRSRVSMRARLAAFFTEDRMPAAARRDVRVSAVHAAQR